MEYVTLRNRLFIDEAQKLLFERIKKAGLITVKKENFNFTDLQWPIWKEYYFRRIKVPGMFSFPPDGLMAAMGDFDFRFLADGLIEPTNSGFRIEVTRVKGFVWDSFNFDGEQALEYWSCAHESFQGLDPADAIYLLNSDFRAFQAQIKMGNDFLVLSQPKMVDCFEGYQYDVKI